MDPPHCDNCALYGDGWQGFEAEKCYGDGEYHEPDDYCDFWYPKTKGEKSENL